MKLRLPTIRQVQYALAVLVLSQLLVTGALVVNVVAQSQSQETWNALQQRAIQSNGDRITAIEQANMPLRIGILESNVSELMLIYRSLFLGMIGQLVISVMGLREAKKRSS